MSFFSSPASSPASSPSLFRQIHDTSRDHGCWVRHGDIIPEFSLLPPAGQTADNDYIVGILATMNVAADHVTPAEMTRARNMLALHSITPQRAHDVVIELAHGARGTGRSPTGAERRVALAALAGIVIGLEPKSAQKLVDQARDKPLGEILSFVAQQAAAVGVIAGSTAGGLWLTRAGVDLAVKGKVGGMVAAKYGLAGVLKVASGVGMFVAGGFLLVGGVTRGLHMIEDNNQANEHLRETTLEKDMRILQGLQQGVLSLPNHPPVRGGT